jgi:hypothetical protein
LLDALEVVLGALLSSDRSHTEGLPTTLPRPTSEPPRRSHEGPA